MKVGKKRWQECTTPEHARMEAAELSKEKLNVLSSGAIITNLTGLPTRVSTARLGKALNGLCNSEAPRGKKKACVRNGCGWLVTCAAVGC